VQRAEGLDKLAWTHGLPTQQRQHCLKQTQAMLLEAIAANQPATKNRQQKWTHGLPTQQRQQCLKQTQAMLLEANAASQPATNLCSRNGLMVCSTQQRQHCLKQTQAMLLEANAANQPAMKNTTKKMQQKLTHGLSTAKVMSSKCKESQRNSKEKRCFSSTGHAARGQCRQPACNEKEAVLSSKFTEIQRNSKEKRCFSSTGRSTSCTH